MLRLSTFARPLKAWRKPAPLSLRIAGSGAVLALIAGLGTGASQAAGDPVGLDGIPGLAVSGADLACVLACAVPPGPDRPPVVIVSPERLLAGSGAPLSGPEEPANPPFEIDWSVGLRGSYKDGTNGSGYALTLVPQISLTSVGLRRQYVVEAQTSVTYAQDQTVRVEQGQLSASGQYALDALTLLSGSAALALSQDDPDGPGMDQIIATPLVLNMEAQAGVARQFARLSAELTGNFSRRLMSDTILVGGVVRDNTSRNSTTLGASLRTSYQLTPVVSVFAQGDAGKDWFDAPSPSSGLYQNGWDLGASIGLGGDWRQVFKGQASVGYALRGFDEAGISPLASVIYALELSYSPNQALSAGAEFSSAINPENTQSGAPASLSYSAGGNFGLALNSLFGLRASIAANWVVPVTGDETTTSFSAGAGADFTLNKQTSVNLDYLYSKSEQAPDPAQDQQLVTLGVTFSR